MNVNRVTFKLEKQLVFSHGFPILRIVFILMLGEFSILDLIILCILGHDSLNASSDLSILLIVFLIDIYL